MDSAVSERQTESIWRNWDMKKQLQGIALILIGIQLAIYTIIDPWLPVLGGDLGRVVIPILSVAVSIMGLIRCFKTVEKK